MVGNRSAVGDRDERYDKECRESEDVRRSANVLHPATDAEARTVIIVTPRRATVLTTGVYHHRCESVAPLPLSRYAALLAMVTPNVAPMSTA